MVKSSLNVSFDNDLSKGFPVLVAGLPGVPGYNAFLYLRALYPGPGRILGICPPHVPALAAALRGSDSSAGSGLIVADAENPEEVDRVFREFGIRSVIDASGWCALKSCEHDPALARRLNVDIGRNLMEQARRHGARLIRLSTDLVFDGMPYIKEGRSRLGGYTEEWPVSPVTVYGKMMAEAEELISGGYPEAALLRIALPMGPSFNGHAGAIDWIESRFRKGKPATLYFDEVRSSLYVQDLNRALVHFLRGEARGIFHLGGPLPLSLYQIAQVINRVGEYDPDLLMGCPRAHAGPMPPRAGDVSMDCSKISALLPPGTLRPWPLQSAQVPADASWHRRRETRHAPDSISACLYGTEWPGAWDHPARLLPSSPPVPQAAVSP
jgi:dTDP-4-dehydrorhamnose reductase